MLFQIISDLHIETFKETPPIEDFIIPEADNLIIAGDVGHHYKENQLFNFLKKICSKFKFVIYVLGNHEYYHTTDIKYKHKNKNMKEVYELICGFAKEIPNLHILDKNSIILKDTNICIVGCTLWSQAKKVPKFIVRTPDIDTIKYNNLHAQELAYIKNMIQYCQKYDYKLVVISHHCPTFSVLDKRYVKFNDLYATNLDYLLTKDKIHTWICGHNHVNFDLITNGGTHLVSNQRGKPKDNFATFNFTKTKIISV